MDNNFSDIPKGLRVPTQIPLDKKLWYPSVSAVNLGQNNHLAFSFYKGMRIFCAEERQMYEWKPVVAGDSTLLNSNFTYPAGSPVVNGVVYGGSTYNFVRILEAGDIDLSDYVTRDEIANFITADDLPQIIDYEAKNLASPEPEAISVYKDTAIVGNTHTFNFRKIASSTLSLEVEDDTVYINTPEDINLKSFYVNKDYTGGNSDGSITKPFNTLEAAITAFVGTGTNIWPQYSNTGKIILQTDITVTSPVNVNMLFIEGNGNIIIYTSATAYYFWDVRTMITLVGTQTNGNLNSDISFTLNNAKIICQNLGGFSYHVTKNFVGTGTHKGTYSTFNNVSVEDQSYINFASQYTPLLNSANQPMTMYGAPCSVEVVSVDDYPIFYGEGLNRGGEGSLFLTAISVAGSRNSLFSFVDTTVVLNGLTKVDYSIYRFSCRPKTSGKYRPKPNKNYFTNSGSYVRIEDLLETQTYPTDNNESIISADCMFKVLSPTSGTPLVVKNGTLLLMKGTALSCVINNLVRASKDSPIDLTNFYCYGSVKSLSSAFAIDNTYTAIRGDLYVSIENSSIRSVVNNTQINLGAGSAIVNGAMFTSASSFADDTSAITGGLVRGNLYYNTTTNSIKKVV